MKDDTLLAIGSSTPEIDLADGSVVHLRQDARLEYPRQFGSNKRIVELEEGEAYFDIARDESRKFIVETEYADIIVLGTEFDIDIDDGVLEVHVTEGKVRIDPDNSELYLELTAGQSAYFDIRTGELKKEKIGDMNEVAWFTKRLSFKNEKLSAVVEVLEEAFDVKINIENSELKNCKVTSTNNSDTELSGMLAAIVQIWDCKVIQEGSNSYTLRGGSCN